MGQIFPTASLHREHSISYALVCEKEISHLRGRKPRPWLNTNPESEIYLFYMDKFMMDCVSPTFLRFFV